MAYIGENKPPAEAAIIALRSGVLTYIGGKAAEKAIGAVLNIPLVKAFIAKNGGKFGAFVEQLLCKLTGKCFIAGTLVQVEATEEMSALFANSGSTIPETTLPLSGMAVAMKPIEQIHVGDKVASRDPDTGKTEFKRVVSTKVHTTQTLLVLTLADKATGKDRCGEEPRLL